MGSFGTFAVSFIVNIEEYSRTCTHRENVSGYICIPTKKTCFVCKPYGCNKDDDDDDDQRITV